MAPQARSHFDDSLFPAPDGSAATWDAETQPVSALFPHETVRSLCDDFLSSALAAAHARVVGGRVTPRLDRSTVRARLIGFDFAAPRSLEDVISWVIAQMEDGIVHFDHPRYLGLFNPAPSFPAQCADRIAAVFNPQLATASTSPAAVEIERHTIVAVARRAGLTGETGGNFTTGGTEANYTALLCALTRACAAFASDGARAFAGPPVFYVSGESHLAWLKIAHQAGIGRTAARMIETDGNGRMRPDSLAAAIEHDRRHGCIPVMIAATAGTTGAGAIDPLVPCAKIAREAGLWYHVDAAWGGALIASDRLRHRLEGIERADSITIDAHKWFAATMGCGMFITKRASQLPEVFGVSAAFMPPSGAPNSDPYTSTLQWSRRFLGLRLFLSLAAAGWAGYGAHVERAVALGALLADALATRGWRIANEPSLGVVCAEPPAGGSTSEIVRRVVASGQAWVSTAMFEGREVVRACITNGKTTRRDIMAAVGTLQAACRGHRRMRSIQVRHPL
jgi:glutamate/tyrosine decarboxylase-like PLP-dependent enzyme